MILVRPQMRVIRLAFAFMLLASANVHADDPLHSRQGVIRNEKCAVRVGESILISVYGAKQVRSGRRFLAKLDEDRWYVHQLPPPKSGNDFYFGGGYHITLSRKDGRVLEIGLDE